MIGYEQNLFQLIFQDKMAEYVLLQQINGDKVTDFTFFDVTFFLLRQSPVLVYPQHYPKHWPQKNLQDRTWRFLI